MMDANNLYNAFQIMQPDDNGNVRIDLSEAQGNVTDFEITIDQNSIAVVSAVFFSSTASASGRIIDPSGASGERSYHRKGFVGAPRKDVLYITFINVNVNSQLYLSTSYYK